MLRCNYSPVGVERIIDFLYRVFLVAMFAGKFICLYLSRFYDAIGQAIAYFSVFTFLALFLVCHWLIILAMESMVARISDTESVLVQVIVLRISLRCCCDNDGGIISAMKSANLYGQMLFLVAKS